MGDVCPIFSISLIKSRQIYTKQGFQNSIKEEIYSICHFMIDLSQVKITANPNFIFLNKTKQKKGSIKVVLALSVAEKKS